MDTGFQTDMFYGCLIRGSLYDAMDYLRRFPEQTQRLSRYQTVFEQDLRPVLHPNPALAALLDVYQQYYRDVFYRNVPAEEAEAAMCARFAALLPVEDGNQPLDMLEDTYVAAAFTARGLHFLGGRTSGYYGPYIWRTSEDRIYDVEQPNGVQPYAVRLLDGFICRSWLDYLSFGEIGTGGWIGDDGAIHCVKSSYDLQSEAFTVSLLKHEAQHAMDLASYKGISSAELEYRAKLVELIYSQKRRLLPQLILAADCAQPGNGHALAAERIAADFAAARGCARGALSTLGVGDVQETARALFQKSSRTLRETYGQACQPAAL